MLITHCGWVVLWRDQVGRNAGLIILQYHSCAVLSSGAVFCWGYNFGGQVIAAAVLRGGWVCVGRRCATDKMISAGRRQHHDRSTRARCCCWFGQRRCKRCCRRGTFCSLELYFWVISCFCFVCCCECWDVCVCLVGLLWAAWIGIGEVYAADYPLWLGFAVAGSGGGAMRVSCNVSSSIRVLF